MNPATFHGMIGQSPKDSNGEFIVEEYLDSEILRSYQDGEVVKVKINV